MIIPAINIMSLLCAQNTSSVCKKFFGKSGSSIAIGIASYSLIDPFEIPILCDDNPIVFNGWTKQVYIHRSVARLAKGVPNAKERPVLACPWTLDFKIEYQENKICTAENLREALVKGGVLGLGTFRPFFGRYELTAFEEIKEV